MFKNNLDKLGMVSDTQYSQEQLRETFKRLKVSNLTDEFHTIITHHEGTDEKRQDVINLKSGLSDQLSGTLSETVLTTATDLQEPVQQ